MLTNATEIRTNCVRYELTGNCEAGIGVISLSELNEHFPRYTMYNGKIYGWSGRWEENGVVYVTYIR